ncbi:hypothetical protein D3C74_388720 [compost metagenome]
MIEKAPAKLNARAMLLPMSRMMMATMTGRTTIVRVKLWEYVAWLVFMYVRLMINPRMMARPMVMTALLNVRLVSVRAELNSESSI